RSYYQATFSYVLMNKASAIMDPHRLCFGWNPIAMRRFLVFEVASNSPQRSMSENARGGRHECSALFACSSLRKTTQIVAISAVRWRRLPDSLWLESPPRRGWRLRRLPTLMSRSFTRLRLCALPLFGGHTSRLFTFYLTTAPSQGNGLA